MTRIAFALLWIIFLPAVLFWVASKFSKTKEVLEKYKNVRIVDNRVCGIVDISEKAVSDDLEKLCRRKENWLDLCFFVCVMFFPPFSAWVILDKIPEKSAYAIGIFWCYVAFHLFNKVESIEKSYRQTASAYIELIYGLMKNTDNNTTFKVLKK